MPLALHPGVAIAEALMAKCSNTTDPADLEHAHKQHDLLASAEASLMRSLSSRQRRSFDRSHIQHTGGSMQGEDDGKFVTRWPERTPMDDALAETAMFDAGAQSVPTDKGQKVQQLMRSQSEEREKALSHWSGRFAHACEHSRSQAQSAAAACKKKLMELEHDAESKLRSLEDDKGALGKFERTALNRILSAVLGQAKSRSNAIDELEKTLVDAIDELLSNVHTELYQLAQALLHRAKLCQSDAERHVEDCAYEANLMALQMRKDAAQMVASLRERDAELEASWHDRWETAFKRWEEVRAAAAEDVCRDRIRALREPVSREHILQYMAQEEARQREKLLEKFSSLQSFLPPEHSLTADSAAQWTEVSRSAICKWNEFANNVSNRLEDTEQEESDNAQALLDELRSELEQLECVEQGHAAEEASERDRIGFEIAQQKSEEVFNKPSRWSEAVEAVASVLESAGRAIDDANDSIENARIQAENDLQQRRAGHANTTKALEQALQQEVDQIHNAQSEEDIDDHTTKALQKLDEMDEAARQFRYDVGTQTGKRVENVRQAIESGLRSVCHSLCVLDKKTAEQEAVNISDAQGADETPPEQHGSATSCIKSDRISESHSHVRKSTSSDGNGTSVGKRHKRQSSSVPLEMAEKQPEMSTEHSQLHQRTHRHVFTASDGTEYVETADLAAALTEGLGKDEATSAIDEIRQRVIEERIADCEYKNKEESSTQKSQNEAADRELQLALRTIRPRYGQIEEGDAAERRMNLASIERKAASTLRALESKRSKQLTNVASALENERNRQLQNIRKLERGLSRVQQAPNVEALEAIGRDVARERDRALDELSATCERLYSYITCAFQVVESAISSEITDGSLAGSEAAVQTARAKAETALGNAQTDRDAYYKNVKELEKEMKEKIHTHFNAVDEALNPHRADLKLANEIAQVKRRMQYSLTKRLEQADSEMQRLEDAVQCVEKLAKEKNDTATSPAEYARALDNARYLLRQRCAVCKCLTADTSSFQQRIRIHDFLGEQKESISASSVSQRQQQQQQHSRDSGSEKKKDSKTKSAHHEGSLLKEEMDDDPSALVDEAEAVAKEGQEAFNAIAREHYASYNKQQGAVERECVRPEEIPTTGKAVENKGIEAAEEVRQKARERANSDATACYAAAVRLCRSSPSVAEHVIWHLSSDLQQEIKRIVKYRLDEFNEGFNKLREQRDSHGKKLRPSLGKESCVNEVDALEKEETYRHQAALRMILHFESSAAENVDNVLQSARNKLCVCVSRLLWSLDGFVEPTEMAEWVRTEEALSGLHREQLSDLRRRLQHAGSLAAQGMEHADIQRSNEPGRASQKRNWRPVELSHLSSSACGLTVTPGLKERLEEEDAHLKEPILQQNKQQQQQSPTQKKSKPSSTASKNKHPPKETSVEAGETETLKLRALDMPAQRSTADAVHRAVNTLIHALHDEVQKIKQLSRKAIQEEDSFAQRFRDTLALVRSEQQQDDGGQQ